MNMCLFLVAVSTIWVMAVEGTSHSSNSEDGDMFRNGDNTYDSTPQCSAMKYFT